MWFRLYFKMFVMCRYYFIDRDMAKEICLISIIKKKRYCLVIFINFCYLIGLMEYTILNYSLAFFKVFVWIDLSFNNAS